MERLPRPADGHFYESARDRLRFQTAEAAGASSRALYTASLGIVVFLFVLALSLRQVTSPGTAERVLQAGLGSLTEVDTVLAEHGAELRQAATTGTSETIQVPGYPLRVLVTRDEALKADATQLRAVVLQRAAAAVYEDGLGTFDRTGRQDLGLLSSQASLRFTLGQLTAENHDRATIATVILLLPLVGLAIATLLAQRGFARLRALGIAFLGGAVPGVVLFAAIRFLWGRYGGADAFRADIRTIAVALADVPLKNFGVVAVLGLVLVVTGVVLGRLGTRFGAGSRGVDTADDDEDDGDYVSELETTFLVRPPR